MTQTRSRTAPTGIVAAATFLVGLVVFLVLLRGGGGGARALLLDYDPGGFEDRVAERLADVTLRPTALLRVRADRVVWRDDRGAPFLQAPSLTFSVDVRDAIGGTVVVRDGSANNVDLDLVRYENGVWNYERPLAPWLGEDRANDNDDGGGTRFLLRNVVLGGADVTITFPDAEYAARSLDARLTAAEVSGPGVTAPEFLFARAEGVLELPDTATGRVTRDVALSEGVFRLVDGALAFEIDHATFGASTLGPLAGVWDPGVGGYGLDARIAARDFRLADLPWLRADAPTDAAGSFQLRLEPLAGERTALTFTDLAVASVGSAATGSARAITGPDGFAVEAVDVTVDPLDLALIEPFTGPLPYSGAVRGRITGTGGELDFDLRATLAAGPTAATFTTDLTGRIAFTEQGVQVREVTADLDRAPLAALEAVAPGLPLTGEITGTVSMEGAPGEAPVRLDVRLEAGGGIVTVAGLVDLRGDAPRYEVTGELLGVELRQLVQPSLPPVQVHARFALDGVGTDPETAVARLTADGNFTGWQSEPGDTLRVVATATRGLLDAEALRLDLGPIAMQAAGEWRFAGGSGGSIRYDLAVSNLDPIARYIPTDPGTRPPFTTGALQAAGTLAGTLERPRVEGRIEATDFRYGEWAAERLTGRYIAGFGAGLPEIEAVLGGTALRTPTGSFARAAVDLDFTRPTFDFSLQAEQQDGGVLEVEAGGVIEEEGGREIVVRRAEVDLSDQRWGLPNPARIAWVRGEAVRVEGLRLEQRDGDGLLAVDGVIAPLDQVDFAIEAVRLPVGEVIDAVGSGIPLDGRLSLEGRVRGPAELPTLDLGLALAEGSFREVPIRFIEGSVEYVDGGLALEAEGLLGDSARVELGGQLPARLTLGLPPRLELIDAEPIQLRLVTRAFPLATLDPGIRMVQDLEGLLMADIQVAGTAGEPRLDGRMAVSGGAVTVTVLDQRYSEIAGSATLSGRELRIDSLSAVSGGRATVDGVVTFTELIDPELDLVATFSGFRPQSVRNESDAAAFGELRLVGTRSAPRMTGEVRLEEGAVDITPFTAGPQFNEQLVGIAESTDPFDPTELGADPEAPVGLVVSELEVVAGDNLWFVTDQMRAQMRGRLTIETQEGNHTVVGTLEGDQGRFNLRAGPVTRRFEIIAASIRFFGTPEPDPAIDVTASRAMRNADGSSIDLRARLTGTLSSPNLSLATADGATIPESDLLSFLVFGRQTGTLGDVAPGEGAFLGEAFAFFGTFDLLAEQLSQGADLPFDYFQVQMRPGAGVTEFRNLYVVVGEELEQIRDDLYATVEAPLDRQDDTWIGSLEWRIDRQWTIELSRGPVRYSSPGGMGSISEFIEASRQWLGVVRRRWTY